MTIRLLDVNKWQRLEAGKGLSLPSDKTRVIRLEVNAPAPARLDAVQGDNVTFLAVVEGYEIIEFAAEGDVLVSIDSIDDVWFYTDDGDLIGFDNPHAESFTSIMNRQSRNPEIERMMFMIDQRNAQRHEALRTELLARGVNPETGEVLDDQDGDATASSGAESAGGAPGGGSEQSADGTPGGDSAATGVPPGPAATAK